jgi:hypothetical protein
MAASRLCHQGQSAFSATPTSSTTRRVRAGSARVRTSSVAEYCSMRCGVPRVTNQRSTDAIVVVVAGSSAAIREGWQVAAAC